MKKPDGFRAKAGCGLTTLALMKRQTGPVSASQLYDKMALAGRVRGNEAGRPPLALMVVPIPESAWGA